MSPSLIEALKVWFIFSVSLGCWTCLTLAVSRRGDPRVKSTIFVFIALLLAPQINAYANLITAQPIQWLTILSQKLTWAYGPISIFLIQHILLKKTHRKTILLHALPFIFMTGHEIFNLHWLSFPLTTSILFLQVIGYFSYAIYLLKTHRTRILSLATKHQNTTYYWLLYLILSLLFIMVFDLIIYARIYFGILPSTMLLAGIASLLALYVNGIALFSLYQPDVFFHVLDAETPEETPKVHLRSIELSPEAAKQLDEQLQNLVKTHKPHLDDNISLPKLASLLGITTHQLSELLNIHKHMSFYDFLNDLRYQESIAILNGHHHELTIADIAYQAGFNNRNSFYKVFKEKTGITPTQYKKNNG